MYTLTKLSRKLIIARYLYKICGSFFRLGLRLGRFLIVQIVMECMSEIWVKLFLFSTWSACLHSPYINFAAQYILRNALSFPRKFSYPRTPGITTSRLMQHKLITSWVKSLTIHSHSRLVEPSSGLFMINTCPVV